MATKQIAWQTGSGNITLTYQGHGDGPISVQSDENNGAARSQVITVQTLDGVVTRNLTVSQAACPIPEGTVLDYSYTGTVQEVFLPAGTYRLQCWGAQGGSVSGSYTATGAKGGYSEGTLTLSSLTTLYIFVGGKGSDASTSTTSGTANGGWNGGGGAARYSSYNSGDTNGISYPRPGGGATDISTVTSDISYSSYRNNRSAASLNARLIVAGGGAGASARYTSETVETLTDLGSITFLPISSTPTINGHTGAYTNDIGTNTNAVLFIDDNPFAAGDVIEVTLSQSLASGGAIRVGIHQSSWAGSWGTLMAEIFTGTTSTRFTAVATTSNRPSVEITCYNPGGASITVTFKKVTTSTSTSSGTSNGTQVGGGTSGGGTNPGTQSGGGGELGKGANMTQTGYRYCSGGGGGGYYGGGASYDDSTTDKINQSGGGSGYVGSLENAQTKAGNTSFPSTSGSTETGHSGDGYARITRLQDEGYEAKIEYLRSTGTQYIDTGIKGASDVKIVIDGKYNNTSSNQAHGSYVSPIFYLGVYRSKFIFRSGASSATSPVSANTNRHVFSMESGIGKVDDTSYTIGSYSGNEGDYLYLFARKKSSGVDLPASFWLYSCQIYKNNVLVRDFIPVRIGQTGYLYDKVSGYLFGNIGSGSFTLGPDVQ